MPPHHRCFVDDHSSVATSSTSAHHSASNTTHTISRMDNRDDVRNNSPERPVTPPDKGDDRARLDNSPSSNTHDRIIAHAQKPSQDSESVQSIPRIADGDDVSARRQVSAHVGQPSESPHSELDTEREQPASRKHETIAAGPAHRPAIAEGGPTHLSPSLATDRESHSTAESLSGPSQLSTVVSLPERSTPSPRQSRPIPHLHRSISATNLSQGPSSSAPIDRISMSRPSSSHNTPANPARFVNPDSHWLSEDEGVTQHRHRRTRRRHRRSSLTNAESDTESFDSQDKDGNGLARPVRSGRHDIHHRPARVSPISPPQHRAQGVEEAQIQATVPILLHRLTCGACGYLLRDPTTLACGHAVCLSCDSADDDPAPVVDLPFEVIHGVPSTESLFARNPDQPIASVPSGLTAMVRSNSQGTVSSLGRRSRITCPYPNCTKKDRGVTLTEHRVDFVLQKVLDVIRRDIPGIDEAVARAKEASDEHSLAQEDVLAQYDGPVRRLSGSSSYDSDPVEGDETKRTHSARSHSAAAKRVRRRAAPPGSKEDPVPSAVEFLDLKSIPSTFLADLQSELECQVCVQLFLDPLTAPCGHTFCQQCLQRALDHSDKCPLCRSDFPSFAYISSTPTNHTTQAILLSAFGKLSTERREAAEAESRSAALDTPIFVCTLAWPSLPTYIHVFEPRYRLMIRRALEKDRQFGMVLPDRSNGGVHEYGTMLYINSCNLIEDGRSILETVGTYRFRVLEKGTFDGYTVARIERIDDISPQQEEELERVALARNASLANNPNAQKELSTAELMQLCLGFVETLRSGSAPWVLQRLNNTIGPMPTNPADFSFWMAEVMPVDDHLKASLLQITSPRERLRLIVFWIEQFRSSWWFSRGCSLM